MALPTTRFIYNSINAAYERISPHVLRTPLQHSLFLSQQTKCNVYLKMESEQITGSLKIRGAFNKLKVLDDETKDLPIVAASCGNHGISMAYALSALNKSGTVYVPKRLDAAKEDVLKMHNIEIKKYGTDLLETKKEAKKVAESRGGIYGSPTADLEQITGSFKARGAFNKLKLSCSDAKEDRHFTTASSGNHGMAFACAHSALNKSGTVYVPTYVSAAKEDVLKLYDIEIKKYGSDYIETEKQARKAAESGGGVYISPYADLQVIYGHGTVGKEIVEDLSTVDAIFVAVGGGGIISGIGAYAKQQNKSIEIVGCQPANSPVMMESVKAGKIVEMESFDTLSDATAGGIEEGSVSFPLCQKLVDRWMKVTEEEIARAMYLMLDKHHKVVEGSAGVALAAFLNCSKEYVGKNVVVLICGGNVSIEKLKFVINSTEADKK